MNGCFLECAETVSIAQWIRNFLKIITPATPRVRTHVKNIFPPLSLSMFPPSFLFYLNVFPGLKLFPIKNDFKLLINLP